MVHDAEASRGHDRRCLPVVIDTDHDPHALSLVVELGAEIKKWRPLWTIARLWKTRLVHAAVRSLVHSQFVSVHKIRVGADVQEDNWMVPKTGQKVERTG